MKKLNLYFFFLVFLSHFLQPILFAFSPAQKTALGELLVVEFTPIAQLQFVYNLKSDVAEEKIVGSSSIIYSDGMAILQTTGPGIATLSHKLRAYAEPGQGVSCIFAAVYENGDPETSQIVGIGNRNDGFFFQLSNSIFGILYRNNSIDTVIPQKEWNVDPMDGTGPSGIILDFTKGNIFKIQYQWLGFGNINFYIESSLTGEPLLVHQIQYANANTNPSLSDPGLQLMAEVVSPKGKGQLNISSMALFLEGQFNQYLGIRNSVMGSKSVEVTPLNILTIQDKTFFYSKSNQIMVILDQLSLFNTSEGSADAIFSLYLNPIIDGSPVFSDVNSNSVVSYDTSGTTLSGGLLLGTFFLSSGSSLSVNMNDYGIQLSPGDSLAISCATATSSRINVYASFSWLEQF